MVVDHKCSVRYTTVNPQTAKIMRSEGGDKTESMRNVKLINSFDKQTQENKILNTDDRRHIKNITPP